MNLGRVVAVVALLGLLALPVEGAICAVLCDSAASDTASATPHHHGATTGHETTHQRSGLQLQASSGHDCDGREAALLQAWAPASEKASSPSPVPAVIVAAPVRLGALETPTSLVESSTVPDTIPPTSTPLVLRV